MASQAPNNLPLLYRGIEPLNREMHGDKKLRLLDRLPMIGQTHAVPVTVDEFAFVQRFYPIIFSVGDNPVPLALMGLHEGTNTFFSAEGQTHENSIYVPAYLRRYPFMLVRLNPDSDQLSLCFDPESDAIGNFKDGQPLFEGDEPSQTVKDILRFSEEFEQSGQRTQAFMTELKASGLLMDGEVAIQPDGFEQPFLYRGFQMVDEAKFRDLKGNELRKMNQNGMLQLIVTHMGSLSLIRDLFARHIMQGSGPKEMRIPEEASVEA